MLMLNQACVDNILKNAPYIEKLVANKKLMKLSKNRELILSLFENKFNKEFDKNED